MHARQWYNTMRVTLALAAAVRYPAIATPLAAQQPAEQPAAPFRPEIPKPLSSAPKPAPPQAPLAFTDVTVVDVADGRLHSKQTVVIRGNRIRHIGPARKVTIPRGIKVVNAAGKYLIPGLWDMHAHIDFNVGMYPLYIAGGVTGVREMAQRFWHGTDSFRVWQREVMSGTRIGPRGYGPSTDVTNFNGIDKPTPLIQAPEEAPRIIDSLKADGVRFLKFHGGVSNDVFFAIAREARRVGLPLVGHAPPPADEASDSGMRSIEHLQYLSPCWPDPLNLAAPDFAAIEAQCKPMIAKFLRNGTWYTPTLMFDISDSVFIKFSQKFLRTIYALGMRQILAGTDRATLTPDLDLMTGVPLLQEVILLAGGITPLGALQAATLNPAMSMQATDSLGTVAEGKLADLVLLDDNPLADIRNILKIRAVVANGRYFDEQALGALAPYERLHARELAKDTANGLPSWIGTHYP